MVRRLNRCQRKILYSPYLEPGAFSGRCKYFGHLKNCKMFFSKKRNLSLKIFLDHLKLFYAITKF